MTLRAHVNMPDLTPDDARVVRGAVDAWGATRARVVALAIIVALTLATATAQKDFEDVSVGLLRALEAIERPCALYGIGPFEFTYARCGGILDSLTTVNKTIIERRFADAGYTLFIPWELEQYPDGPEYVAVFARGDHGTLRYMVVYSEYPARDASHIIIIAEWFPGS